MTKGEEQAKEEVCSRQRDNEAKSGGAESSQLCVGSYESFTFLMGDGEARWWQVLELILGIGTQFSI